MADRNTVSYEGEVVLRGARFHCTKCGKWKDGSKFGLRKMRDGTIRNQAQCNGCRANVAGAHARA